MKKTVALKRIVLIVLLFVFASFQNSAQYFGPAVHGTVTDEQDNPLCGAVVQEVQNIGNSVITDLNGHYSINITRGNNSILEFSFSGYKTKRIRFNGQLTIDVKMEEDK